MAKKVKITQTPDLSCRLTPKLLGEAVRARRTQSNLKLADAAALCGVAKQTLANIEGGKESSQINTVLQVCSGLGIKIFIHPWYSGSGREDE